MVKTEICRKITGLNGRDMQTLVYSLTTDDSEMTKRYGVCVGIEENSEETTARGLTSDRERAEQLLDLLATYFITPSSLNDVVHEWLAAL